MKRIVAILGIMLLCFPLWTYGGFRRRIGSASTTVELLSALHSVFGGFMIGFAGLMILGFLIDGGAGYRKPMLLAAMLIIGVVWLGFYPSGWLLGLPLIIYPLSKKLGLPQPVDKRNENPGA